MEATINTATITPATRRAGVVSRVRTALVAGLFTPLFTMIGITVLHLDSRHTRHIKEEEETAGFISCRVLSNQGRRSDLSRRAVECGGSGARPPGQAQDLPGFTRSAAPQPAPSAQRSLIVALEVPHRFRRAIGSERLRMTVIKTQVHHPVMVRQTEEI